MIFFRIDWCNLLAVQGTGKSLLQLHNSKASVLQRLALFMVQLSHLYMTTGKTTALTRWTFISKVMSLLFNMLSRFVIAFLPSSKHFFNFMAQPGGLVPNGLRESGDHGSSMLLPIHGGAHPPCWGLWSGKITVQTPGSGGAEWTVD